MIILKLHCLVKFALSIRAIPAFDIAEEEVKVLIAFTFAFTFSTENLEFGHCICRLHDFSKVIQFPSFLWFWYCARAPVPTPSVTDISDELSCLLIQKGFRGLQPLPYLVRPMV